MRYHPTSPRIAKVNKTDHVKCWQRYKSAGTPTWCWWEHKMIASVLKIGLFLKCQIYICSIIQQFLGIYQKEMQMCVCEI